MGKSGFTLIELMIVVAIIAVIAAIAIPNLMRSRIQANESAAIGNLKTIAGAQVTYYGGNFQYAADFPGLTTPVPSYLEGDWTKTKEGYNFVMDSSGQHFTVYADPAEVNISGERFFSVNASGVIRYAVGARPDPLAGTPIGDI